MSNQSLVNDALSLINVLPSGTDASAEDAELALRVVNEIADEWAEDGIAVNWSPSAVLSDDLELTGSELSAVKYQLAVRLCPHFGREPSQALMGLAGSSLYKLQRNQMVRGIAEIEVSAPASEGWRGVWDITQG
jgi:hypothetical protein